MDTLDKTRIVKQRRKSGFVIWDAGLGENPFPAPTLLTELLNTHLHQIEYTPLNGAEGLETQLKAHYTPTPECILFGNGLKELIFVAQLAFRGTIIHITPSCVSYYKQIACVCKTESLLEIHTSFESQWKITSEQLEHACESINGPIMLLFNNPNNPTSVVYTAQEVEQLSQVCKKYNVLVLADEIYAHLSEYYTSMARFMPCIRGSSISKDIAAAGYKLGWLTFPKEYSDFYARCVQFSAMLYSSPAAPIQYAFRDFLSMSNTYKNAQTNMRQQFANIVQYANKRLQESTNLRFIPTQAAWYLFLDFFNYTENLTSIGIQSSKDLSLLLLEEIGLVCVEGDVFRTPHPLCLRLSLVDIHKNSLQKGVERLIVWLHNI